METLERLLGLNQDPEMVRVVRHPRALPLYHNAYCGRLRDLEKRVNGLPGLHLEANYRGGVSVRDRIACASRAADRVLQDLGRSSACTISLRPRQGDLYGDIHDTGDQPTIS